jgi:hypothetical protein
MKFKQVILYSRVSWWTGPRSSDQLEAVGLDTLGTFSVSPDVYLTLYLSNDFPVASHAFWRQHEQLPGKWRDVVRDRFLRYDFSPEYFHLTMLVNLDVAFAERFRSLNDLGLSQDLHELIEASIPDIRGERVRTRLGVSPTSPIIAYLEPDEGFYLADDNSDKDRYAAAAELQDYFRQRHIVKEPRLLGYAVFFHNTWALGSCRGLLASPLSAFADKHQGTSVPIPSTVEDVLHMAVLVQLLEHMGERLGRLPLSGVSVEQYLSGLDRTGRILDSYRTRFLADRQESESECQRISRLTDLFESDVDRRAPTTWRDSPLSTPLSAGIESSAQLILSDVISDIDREFRTLLAAIRDSCSVTGTVTRMLVDHLRDRTLGETAESNLRLQRAVIRLSVVAVAVALLGLLLAVMPQDTKLRIWGLVLHLVRQQP